MKNMGLFLYVFFPLDTLSGPTGGYNQSHYWCQNNLVGLFSQNYDCSDNAEENEFRDRAPPRALALGVMFLLEALIGILGNFYLLCHYIFLYHTNFRLRTTDLFLIQIMIANFLVILSKSVPQMMRNLGFQPFFTDLGCRIVLYVQKVARGVSIGNMCLLSVFQTIMISPVNSCWKKLRAKVSKSVGLSIFFSWILYILTNLTFPMYKPHVPGTCNSKDTMKKRDVQVYSINPEKIEAAVYTVLVLFPEVLFMVLIIWSSLSMILILVRHRQQVQHIHRSKLLPRSSAESRAIQNTFLLASTFVYFHTLSSILYICVSCLHHPSIYFVSTTELLSLCFPTVSPFLLLIRDSAVSKVSLAWLRNRMSHHLPRNL